MDRRHNIPGSISNSSARLDEFQAPVNQRRELIADPLTVVNQVGCASACAAQPQLIASAVERTA